MKKVLFVLCSALISNPLFSFAENKAKIFEEEGTELIEEGEHIRWRPKYYKVITVVCIGFVIAIIASSLLLKERAIISKIETLIDTYEVSSIPVRAMKDSVFAMAATIAGGAGLGMMLGVSDGKGVANILELMAIYGAMFGYYLALPVGTAVGAIETTLSTLKAVERVRAGLAQNSNAEIRSFLGTFVDMVYTISRQKNRSRNSSK